MKKTLFIAAALLAFTFAAAQDDRNEDFATRYNRLVAVGGYDGVGIETLLDKWEDYDKYNPQMLEARFNYYLKKSFHSQAVHKNQAKYLGQKPIMTLKDSTGRDLNYFEELFFDDELFGKATTYIEKAIKANPNELALRFDYIGALISYEKESPDIAREKILELIADNGRLPGKWTYEGNVIDAETFASLMQEYCRIFFNQGTPKSYEVFLVISEKMFAQYPGNLDFLNNQGAYWASVNSNPRKAIKIFEKVLKKNPDNRTALTNCVLLYRKLDDRKKAGAYQIRLANLPAAQ
ncbi:MAG: hypothetical protein MJY48_02055 [Bacteroidales bacterium]|nr:hypothetical protein [Bacteroidales bacterium]